MEAILYFTLFLLNTALWYYIGYEHGKRKH